MGSQHQALIFLHISKTGGSTLRGLILRQYGRNAVFEENNKRDFKEFLDRYEQLPPCWKNQIKVFMGHMPGFGLHKSLPRPSAYVTLLRNPVDRVISAYYHIQRYQRTRPEYKNLSLIDWVERVRIHNAQTKLLAGHSPRSPIAVTEEMLTVAKWNIEKHFALVGLVERYDEALILMKRTLGWRLPVYVRSNIGTNRPEGPLSEEARRVIEDRNELDMQLYRYAEERFEEKVKQAGLSFRAELRALRFLNSTLERLLAMKSPLRPAAQYCLRAVGRA